VDGVQEEGKSVRWVAISGSWKNARQRVEQDVRTAVDGIMYRGDGIVTSAAPGVDCFAVDEALKRRANASGIRIILPAPLDFYLKHTRLRMEEGIIPREEGEPVVSLLKNVIKINPSAVTELPYASEDQHIDHSQYLVLNERIVDVADELVAFHVNGTEGTADAIDRARKKGIPVTVHTYTFEG
jgi:hypothetical protein